jgi:hypothetical protein
MSKQPVAACASERTGIAVPPVPLPSWMPRGDVRDVEDIGPDDTFDGDYGRLLEQAMA